MSAHEEARCLRAVYGSLPMDGCDGCSGCAGRCAGNLRITRTECEAIRDYLDGGGWFPVIRPHGAMVAPCEFQHPEQPWCLVYPARPLICRLFGLVGWLPCPRARRPVAVPDGPRIIATYAQFERRTWRRWLRAETGTDGRE